MPRGIAGDPAAQRGVPVLRGEGGDYQMCGLSWKTMVRMRVAMWGPGGIMGWGVCGYKGEWRVGGWGGGRGGGASAWQQTGAAAGVDRGNCGWRGWHRVWV